MVTNVIDVIGFYYALNKGSLEQLTDILEMLCINFKNKPFLGKSFLQLTEGRDWLTPLWVGKREGSLLPCVLGGCNLVVFKDAMFS